MMQKREIQVCESIQAASYNGECGVGIKMYEKSVIIYQNHPETTRIQINKEEAFRLAYALMSLASEL